MCTPFRLSLIVIGIFALGFQIAAICVKAWVRVGVEQNSNGYVQDSSMHIGLWGLDVCEGLRGWFGENCIHFSFENNFYTDTGVLGDEHRTFNLTLRILTLLGAILALGGLAIMTLYFYQLDSRQEGKSGAIFSALCWFIDACLAISAIAVTLHRYFNMTKATQFYDVYSTQGTGRMETYFPWALVLTGIGGFLALVCGTAMLLRLYKSTHSEYS